MVFKKKNKEDELSKLKERLAELEGKNLPEPPTPPTEVKVSEPEQKPKLDNEKLQAMLEEEQALQNNGTFRRALLIQLQRIEEAMKK